MTHTTVEKSVWIEITEDDISNISKDGDIQCEYEDHMGGEGLNPQDWHTLYERRRSLSVADFLKIVDNLIMDNTGRIL